MNAAEAVHPEAATKHAVIILGKLNNFLYVAPDFDTAVYFVNLYRSGPAPGAEPEPNEPAPRLTLSELDFFDGAGHELLLITDGPDHATGLKVNNPDIRVQDMIRDRVATVYRVALERYAEVMAKIGDPTPPPDPPHPPSAELSFAAYVAELQNDPKVKFDDDRNCCWFAWIMGLC